MRAILQKKIYPQSSSSAAVLSTKKYLESRHMPKSAHHDEDQLNFKAENIGSKWVKTDSECEFLYIYISS